MSEPLQSTGIADSFAARSRLFLERTAAACENWFDPSGACVARVPAESDARERFWLCFALYSSGKTGLADALILAANTAEPVRHKPASHFGIFHTNAAVLLLHRFSGLMSAPVRARLAALATEGFGMLPGNRSPEFQFHGYNDNMPAKATLGLILGGELLGDADAVAHGRWNLRQLAAQLSRRGINSEFNSPTYTPLTLHALGEIAAHARDEESRQLAGDLESRLWLDLASRFHPQIGLASGPYSRAYAADSLGHVSVLASLLWFVLGDRARPSPMEIFDPGSTLVFHHGGNRLFNAAQMSWIAGGTYRPPARARDLFHGKSYPARSVATAEMGHTHADIPAQPIRAETYLEKDYTVGTMSSPFLGGEQSDPYFVTYKRRPEITSVADVGTIFTKFVINGDVPGAPHDHPCAPGAEHDLLLSQGGCFSLQNRSTALVLTHPKLTLGGDPDKPATAAKPLSRIEQQVVFPSHAGGADEIIVGGAPRDSWSGPVNPADWIVCRRGRLLIGYRILAYSALFGRATVSLEKINAYECIRITFYSGEARTFSRAELRQMPGGFVAEHAGVDDYPTLQAFAAHLASAQFSDYVWTTRRVRYSRQGVDMQVSLSVGAQQPRFALINGRPVDWPDLAIDGLDRNDLPLPPGGRSERADYFPWDKLELTSMDGTGFIGDAPQTS